MTSGSLIGSLPCDIYVVGLIGSIASRYIGVLPIYSEEMGVPRTTICTCLPNYTLLTTMSGYFTFLKYENLKVHQIQGV